MNAKQLAWENDAKSLLKAHEKYWWAGQQLSVLWNKKDKNGRTTPKAFKKFEPTYLKIAEALNSMKEGLEKNRLARAEIAGKGEKK